MVLQKNLQTIYRDIVSAGFYYSKLADQVKFITERLSQTGNCLFFVHLLLI